MPVSVDGSRFSRDRWTRRATLDSGDGVADPTISDATLTCYGSDFAGGPEYT